MPDPVRVRAMFARIAGRYDLLNRLLSAGVDRTWRRRTAATAGELGGATVLDVCCGTGDLALEFAGRGARVLGVDFTHEMLDRAGPKIQPGTGPTLFVQGDALRLPVATASVDAATIAFGLRNVADRTGGLAEMARVVRPGGRVLVLEFSMPRRRVSRAVYRLYFTRILPRVGGWISGDRSAYEYLPDTVQAWPEPAELEGEMQALGLVDCGWESLTAGIACLHWGTVPEAGA